MNYFDLSYDEIKQKENRILLLLRNNDNVKVLRKVK